MLGWLPPWVSSASSDRIDGSLLVLLLLGLGLIGATCTRLLLRPPVRELHRRGTLIVRQRRWQWVPPMAAGMHADCLRLAGIAIAPADELKHFKLIGTTGTGKSTAIRELLAQALLRGDRAVISDPDGGYARRFGSRYRGDLILNPFELESVRWDLYGELSNPYDVEQLASALVPTSADPAAQEWRGYSRTFVSALLRRSQADGRRDAAELWRLLTVASIEELRALLAGTPAQPFLEPDNVRMFASIRAVAVSAMAALEYIQAQRAAPFSVRAWIRAGRGALFVPYRAGQIAALRSIIAAWIRLAIVEAMNQPEQHDQRLWFVVDELDALGAIDGMKDALARLRKFGGRCILGFQSLAQVSTTYGHGDAQTIVENCANTLILRCSGSEQGGTSQFASRLIGEREVIRRQRSRGRDRDGLFGARGTRRSSQVSEQQVIESAVLPSELEQLPDLAGYFKSASSRDWARIGLRVPADR
jgi:type IV secretory pathway TraG/TraD family ATPase VirD4